MPFLPGWARVPARRRSLPLRVPPASAQRGAPAPVASSPPPAPAASPFSSPPCRSAPARTAPAAAAAAAAARGEAAAQPGSPRPARRRRSRRHCCRPSPRRAHPSGHTHPAAGAPPRTPQRLRRAPEPGRCDAAHPSPRARHRAPLRGGGSSLGPPWAPSGCGSCPLLGITPEAPAVAAKFPEETRLLAAAQVRKIARGGSQGLFERDGAPGPAERGLGVHGGAAGSGCSAVPQRRGHHAAFRIWGGGPPSRQPSAGGSGTATGRRGVRARRLHSPQLRLERAETRPEPQSEPSLRPQGGGPAREGLQVGLAGSGSSLAPRNPRAWGTW